MTRSITLLAGAAIIAAALGSTAFSQNAPTTPAVPQTSSALPAAPATARVGTIDLKLLGSGSRTSKVVGSKVVNAANDTVGTLDDLIVTPNERVSYAVLSVGGFLGLDAHYVVVPYSALDLAEKQVVLRDGTKETLKSLPEFKYGG